MEFFDSPLREFEFVDLTFDMVLSATCFAQLKRHRMATLTAQDYNPDIGVTVPPSVIEIGQKEEFMQVIEMTNEAYAEMKKHMEVGAEYILTNAHRRRILLKLNSRELYHVSRLREDTTAQWDIRALSQKMTSKAKEVMPLTCLLIGGKDIYPDIYKNVFGVLPKTLPPKY
jgi:thymidylate synthase ThyX